MDYLDEIAFSNHHPVIKYRALTKCHERAIKEAADEKAAIIFLQSDLIWPDETFANLKKIAQGGKRGVMVAASLRVVKETFVPAFLESFYSVNDFTASVSSRELVKLALDHLHPHTESRFWDSPNFHWPDYLYWRVNNEGVLTRAFFLHPLMTSPVRRIIPAWTVDSANYISFAHPNPDDLYIVEDSDEIVGIEISKLGSHGELLPNRSNVFKVAHWAKYYARPYHRRFLTRKIRIHSGDISPRWKEVEKSSDRVVKYICILLKFEAILDTVRLIITLLKLRLFPDRFAVKKFPVHPAIKTNPILKRIFHLVSKSEKVEEYLDKCLKMDETYSENHLALGLLRYYQKRYKEAEEELKKALSWGPIEANTEATILIAFANLYSQQQKYKEAEEKLKKALSLKLPDKTFIYYATGSNYERQGRFNEAIEKFNYVVNNESLKFKGGSHFHLGCIYKELGKGKEARQHFEECLKIIPDHRKAKEYLNE